jgi:hypothetical protein
MAEQPGSAIGVLDLLPFAALYGPVISIQLGAVAEVERESLLWANIGFKSRH